MKIHATYMEGYPDYSIILSYGKKRRRIVLDLVTILSLSLNESKSQVKRVIKGGGLDMVVPKA